jgi:hypothetical protein
MPELPPMTTTFCPVSADVGFDAGVDVSVMIRLLDLAHSAERGDDTLMTQ